MKLAPYMIPNYFEWTSSKLTLRLLNRSKLVTGFGHESVTQSGLMGMEVRAVT